MKYNINEYVVFRKDVCKIKEVKEINNKQYYVLTPITDESLIINIPSNNENIRRIISKEESLNIIDSIPSIEPIEFNEKNIENLYKELLRTGSHKDLIRIIKTSYHRNKERKENNKRLGDKDSTYFAKAEKYLYNELMISLDMTNEELKSFMKERLENKK